MIHVFEILLDVKLEWTPQVRKVFVTQKGPAVYLSKYRLTRVTQISLVVCPSKTKEPYIIHVV